MSDNIRGSFHVQAERDEKFTVRFVPTSQPFDAAKPNLVNKDVLKILLAKMGIKPDYQDDCLNLEFGKSKGIPNLVVPLLLLQQYELYGAAADA